MTKAKKSKAGKAKTGKIKARKASKKRKTNAAVSPDDPAVASLNPLRTGMPALDSITGIKEVPTGKKVYRIIQTNEVDEYEK